MLPTDFPSGQKADGRETDNSCKHIGGYRIRNSASSQVPVFHPSFVTGNPAHRTPPVFLPDLMHNRTSSTHLNLAWMLCHQPCSEYSMPGFPWCPYVVSPDSHGNFLIACSFLLYFSMFIMQYIFTGFYREYLLIYGQNHTIPLKDIMWYNK